MNKFLVLLLAVLVALSSSTSLRAADSKELEVANSQEWDLEDEYDEEAIADSSLWRRILHRRQSWWGVVRRQDIVDTAVSSGLSSLVSFVQQAGLEDVLRGPGPFTVFAPTNAAFRALPAGVVNTLTTDPAALEYVLLYHVVPGQSIITYGNLWRGGGPHATATANAANVTTARYRAGRRGPLVSTVNNAKVVISNVRASNGIVHVIDRVLVPPRLDGTVPPANLPETAEPVNLPETAAPVNLPTTATTTETTPPADTNTTTP